MRVHCQTWPRLQNNDIASSDSPAHTIRDNNNQGYQQLMAYRPFHADT